MRALGFLFRSLFALGCGLALAALLLALIAGYRHASHDQRDDRDRLESKRAYLTRLSQLPRDEARPNIVFILYDDLGYGDVGYATEDNAIDTPNLDALAQGGVVLSDFHSPAPVCTPSRAGYLTGRLPLRAGLPDVVFPSRGHTISTITRILAPERNQRLPAEEITLGDILGASGYATGMVGKWHLGDVSPSLPNDMGFDSYFGALYSNDMTPFAFYHDDEIAVPAPVDQRTMSETYTHEAIRFIDAHAHEDFFLYFAHNFPHDPLHVRKERAGRSRAGLFGDVMEEIDEGVGRLVAALERHGVLDDTWIIVTSDNGPWFLGDAGPARGRKGNTFEGGMRVPFIAHWPRAIASGRVEHAMSMGIDLVPTVLEALGLPAPEDRVLDGRSILELLRRGGASPHEHLFYFDSEELFAVRDERFKYRGPAGVFYATDSMPFAAPLPQKEWLFDLAGDPREAYDTSLKHPEAARRLARVFAAKQEEMAENLRGWK